MTKQEYEIDNVKFTIFNLGNDVYYMSLKELLKFCKMKDRTRFLEYVQQYYSEVIFYDKEKTIEIIPVDIVLRRALKGNSSSMIGLANWVFALFKLTIR